MFRKRIPAIFAAVMLLGAVAANADIVELDLFSLGCPTEYDFNSPYWTTDFDLGVEFTDISNVYMDWAGEITGGLAVYDFHPGEPFPEYVGIYAYLRPPIGHSTSTWGGQSTYPDPEPFDCLSEFGLSGTDTWLGLLDGQGTILIDYTELLKTGGQYVEHGCVTLDGAALVVDGTIVPEPSTILLLTIGMFALRVNERNKSRRYRYR